ncbi:DMT family transporter [bacterium]|nr:DMT family transporter [bacterium]
MQNISKITAESFLIVATAIWGSTFFIIKILVSFGNVFSPFALLSIRFAIASIFSMIIFKIRKIPTKSEFIGGFIIGLAGFAGYMFQTIGLLHTTPARSGFITSLFILFIPFVSKIWEKVKIPSTIYFALIPAILGLWLISGVGKSIWKTNIGDMITLLSAISYAFQIVAIQVYTSRYNWKTLTIISFVVIAIFSSFGLLFENSPQFIFDTRNILGILYLGIIATVGALGIQMFAQKFTTSARASLIYLAEPVFAAIFAYIFISQKMAPTEIFGAFLILISLFIGIIPAKLKNK